MWTYRQKTGALSHDGEAAAEGYSGHGEGLNNPAMQTTAMVGPIPEGVWSIGTAFDHPRLGPVAMHLSPVKVATTRSGFFIHGDNAAMNHTGSDGCIILARSIREAINASADRDLTVTA
jgi:hypothetical protein